MVTESVGLKIQDLGLTSLSHEFARQTADVDEQHLASFLIRHLGSCLFRSRTFRLATTSSRELPISYFGQQGAIWQIDQCSLIPVVR